MGRLRPFGCFLEQLDLAKGQGAARLDRPFSHPEGLSMPQPRLSALLEDALVAAAGLDRPVATVSLALDFGVSGDGDVTVTTRVDRATRSLIFVSALAVWPDGRPAGGGQGVFRVAAV
jgi:hypothetical protein